MLKKSHIVSCVILAACSFLGGVVGGSFARRPPAAPQTKQEAQHPKVVRAQRFVVEDEQGHVCAAMAWHPELRESTLFVGQEGTARVNLTVANGHSSLTFTDKDETGRVRIGLSEPRNEKDKPEPFISIAGANGKNIWTVPSTVIRAQSFIVQDEDGTFRGALEWDSDTRAAALRIGRPGGPHASLSVVDGATTLDMFPREDIETEKGCASLFLAGNQGKGCIMAAVGETKDGTLEPSIAISGLDSEYVWLAP